MTDKRVEAYIPEDLRARRESLGLDIDALALSMGVPVDELHALEEGQLDGLPEGAQRAARIRQYCDRLGLVPAGALAAAASHTGEVRGVPVSWVRSGAAL